MPSSAFLARERRKRWLENLQVAAGASLLTSLFFLYTAILFSLDSLTPAVMETPTVRYKVISTQKPMPGYPAPKGVR